MGGREGRIFGGWKGGREERVGESIVRDVMGGRVGAWVGVGLRGGGGGESGGREGD